MGNAALRELAVIDTISYDAVAGDVVAIDAHNWLYRYLTITVRFTDANAYTAPDGTELANLLGVIRGIPKLLEYDITPIFVFDGTPTDLKSDEIEQRREQRSERAEEAVAAKERGDVVEAARLESQSQRLTEAIHETTRELLDRLDIQWIDAPAEGEAQAAVMARQGIVDHVGSEDYDTLLFGAPSTLRELTTKGDIEQMDFQKTLDRHQITWEQLIDIALLCGTDFNEGVSGYGPKTALEAVHEHGDLQTVLAEANESIPAADKLQSLFLDPTVTEIETIDTSIEPDLDAVQSYLFEEWDLPEGPYKRGLDRLAEAQAQTGLGRWT